MAVRRCRKEDLRRIAKATGGTLVSSLANLEGEESFEASYLGTADEVVQERISDDELILIRGTKVVSSSSIVLRGANDYMLDEMERALHDTLSVIKRTLESGAVVPGGGAVESALSIYLENFATTLVHIFISIIIPADSISRDLGNNLLSPSLQEPSYRFPKHSPLMLQKIRPNSSPSCGPIIMRHRMHPQGILKRLCCGTDWT